MITYIREKPFPKCKHCDATMAYWIPGHPEDRYYHPECEAKHTIEKIIKNEISKTVA